MREAREPTFAELLDAQPRASWLVAHRARRAILSTAPWWIPAAALLVVSIALRFLA